ncbi:MAG: ATP-binding cassette domain-containing protein [Bacteroidota bacterium]
MIQLQHIHIQRGKKVILEDVSAEVRPNALTVLLGPNGAGKSTLLEILSGRITPDQGKVLWENQPIGKRSEIELAQRRTVMSQRVNLSFPIGVAELVEMGCYAAFEETSPAERASIIKHALGKVGLTDFANRDYTTLSGGEQQRVLMAKCIAQLECHYWRSHTQYLFLDEATAGLDIRQKHHLLQVVKGIIKRRGIGVLAIVHDLSLAAQYADRIILLRDGKLVKEGEKSETLTAPLLSHTFSLPAEQFQLLQQAPALQTIPK